MRMKVALVHELLTMKGGAERVLKVFADMFPDAPIYTLLYNEKKLGEWFPTERVRASRHWPLALPNSQFSHSGLGASGPRTAILNSLPAVASAKGGHFFNHHLYLPFFPKAVEAWDFSDFDLVISSSSAFAHGIQTSGKTKHLSYVHSPARYLWDRTHDVQQQSGIARLYLSPLFHRLRMWDAKAAERADMLIAPSKEVQRRLQLYWNRESTVIYPPIDEKWFVERPSVERERSDYFLIVSTLARYKRIELAIDACNKTKQHLKIIGEGADMQRLKALAGPTIEFYGRRDGDELADLYAGARATIFPGYEDLGLVPLESLACGTPVIAFHGGGALETVTEGVTGTFFHEPTADSLAKTLESFDHKKYSEQNCRSAAQKFNRSNFEQEIYSAIERLAAVKV